MFLFPKSHSQFIHSVGGSGGTPGISLTICEPLFDDATGLVLTDDATGEILYEPATGAACVVSAEFFKSGAFSASGGNSYFPAGW